MRKSSLLFILMIVLICSGCKDKYSEEENHIEIKLPEVQSEISKEECGICGAQPKSMMSYYRKMDSVGIVCLNTMNISNTDVRVYDDDGNELLNQNSTSYRLSNHGEEECGFYIQGTPNRGITDVQITYGKKCEPDWGKIKKNLCQDCINKVMDMYQKEIEWQGDEARFPEVCLVDFNTNELYSLGSAHKAYYIRDYYVMMNHQEKSDELTIFYAPERDDK